MSARSRNLQAVAGTDREQRIANLAEWFEPKNYFGGRSVLPMAAYHRLAELVTDEVAFADESMDNACEDYVGDVVVFTANRVVHVEIRGDCIVASTWSRHRLSELRLEPDGNWHDQWEQNWPEDRRVTLVYENREFLTFPMRATRQRAKQLANFLPLLLADVEGVS